MKIVYLKNVLLSSKKAPSKKKKGAKQLKKGGLCFPPHKEQSPVRAFELSRGIFLFGSFFRFNSRRRGGFSFNQLIQLLTADRNSLEHIVINFVDCPAHEVKTPARADNHIPHKIKQSGEEHSEAPQRRIALIDAQTEAQPEAGHFLQGFCEADEHKAIPLLFVNFI